MVVAFSLFQEDHMLLHHRQGESVPPVKDCLYTSSHDSHVRGVNSIQAFRAGGDFETMEEGNHFLRYLLSK